MMKAVVIAAGRGKRLMPFTRTLPKPLVCVNGKPLLNHIMNALRNVGINRCIIITGYLEHTLRRYLGDGSKFNMKIKCCYNPTYVDGNATSLKAAQRMLSMDDKFLLIMADHLINERIIEVALENVDRAPLLCVDCRPYESQVEEATKVLVGVDGYVKDIGKNIFSWNAIDTGTFLLDKQVFNEIKRAEHKFSPPLTLSKCTKQMIKGGNKLWACDVSGCFWLDIDTIEDLVLAEQLLGRY